MHCPLGGATVVGVSVPGVGGCTVAPQGYLGQMVCCKWLSHVCQDVINVVHFRADANVMTDQC